LIVACPQAVTVAWRVYGWVTPEQISIRSVAMAQQAMVA
jgi:hypothetical protein